MFLVVSFFCVCLFVCLFRPGVYMYIIYICQTSKRHKMNELNE